MAAFALALCLSGFIRTLHSPEGDVSESRERLEIRVALARLEGDIGRTKSCALSTQPIDDQIAYLHATRSSEIEHLDPAYVRRSLEIWREECFH